MKILITGSAGFIGMHLAKHLAVKGFDVFGIDNLNSYYDPTLKINRLKNLGINCDLQTPAEQTLSSESLPNLRFRRLDITDWNSLQKLMESQRFDVVINLAAQAGVRYSLQNPRAYVNSNVLGFLNILEGCRLFNVSHLIYASSSSVYGLNSKIPFSEHHPVDHPVSVYAATKKADELLAHAYSHLYAIPTTGLRFFTVYGPWGRPDMSPWLFADAILNNRPIRLFNNGEMSRDFTYIDDIIDGISALISQPPTPNPDWDAFNPDPASSSAPYRILNIGHGQPMPLLQFIAAIENAIGRKAILNPEPIQPGDVTKTWADTSDLTAISGVAPNTPVDRGVKKTIDWFLEYIA